MTTQDQILNFLKITGPLLPSKVAKQIHESILIASAHLADLVTQGKVKISSLKVGGSPLYYLPGQEAQLYQFVVGNLNPKDLQVLNHLKSKLVLKEANLDTLSKLALRSLKDFAVPLHVTVENHRELFWKWHLLSDEETNQVIGSLLMIAELKKVEDAKPAEIPTPASQPAPISTELPAAGLKKESSGVKSEKELKELPITKSKTDAKNSVSPVPEPKAERKVKETRKKTVSKFEVKHSEKPVSEKYISKETEKSEELDESEKEYLAKLLFEQNKKAAEQKSKESEKQTQLKSNKVPFSKKFKEKLPGQSRTADPFLLVVERFFGKLKINVEEKELIRKDAEIDFIVRISSIVGETTYFCKARKKRKCDEKELSAAYMQAQIKKLPLLFLYTNELSPKAHEMLESDVFKNALIKKIE